jgi:hypothetical protein
MTMDIKASLWRLPKRFVLYAAVLLGLLWFHAWDGPRPQEVRLAGSPEALGAQFGQATRLRVKLLCRVYVKGFVCRNKPDLYATHSQAAMKLWPCIGAVYQREFDALAKAAGVDREAVLLGNSFVDLGVSAYGCRAVVAQTPTGLLHGHNLDWDNVGGLANWSITLIRRAPDDGRYRTVAIGLPGLIGALDIANEHGLCLSVNQISLGNGDPVEPVLIRLRRIAETCRTYAEARREILAAPPDMPFALTVSSAEEGLSGVFEPDRDAVTERPASGGRSWADNATWGAADVWERSALGQVVHDAHIEAPGDVQVVLRQPQVLLACNIYSVIFDHAGNRLYLASGSTPAAPRAYRVFELFGSLPQGSGRMAK